MKSIVPKTIRAPLIHKMRSYNIDIDGSLHLILLLKKNSLLAIIVSIAILIEIIGYIPQLILKAICYIPYKIYEKLE